MGAVDDERELTPSAVVPPALVDGLLRLCQGEFDFRLPRTLARDEPDTIAFFFNAIAEEIERLVTSSREHEARLAGTIERLSNALIRVASGEFVGVEVERDFRGDSIDVLVFLVNNTIRELGILLTDKEKRALEDKRRLEQLVELGSRRLDASEENFRRLFEVAPQPLVLFELEDCVVRQSNRRAARMFESTHAEMIGRGLATLFEEVADARALVVALEGAGYVENLTLPLRTPRGRSFWAIVDASVVTTAAGEKLCVAGFADLTAQKEVEEQLRAAATTDALTGTLSRRRLFEVASHEWSRARRYERPLCVALVDLDHFKAINDRFGHPVGDDCLRKVGAELLRSLRAEDWVGRYGGEEFALIFPETRIDAATEALERIRVGIAHLGLGTEEAPIPLTVSGGVVARAPDESFDDALTRADEALYRAKSGGRDRIVVG